MPLTKLTGSGMSWLSNLCDLSTNGETQVPAEHQIAMKLLCRTPLCCQLLETNCFKDLELLELMAFMPFAINWDTVARCVMQRAIRDARAFDQVLYLLQAGDISSPLTSKILAAKLVNTVYPMKTGGGYMMCCDSTSACVFACLSTSSSVFRFG